MRRKNYTVTIKKGDHHGSPSLHCLLYKPQRLTIDVSFGHSWKYELPGDDQYDICKIGGLVNLSWWKLLLVPLLPASAGMLIREHHRNSMRWGVNYDPKQNNMMLHAYCYVNGERISWLITRLDMYTPYTLELTRESEGTVWRVINKLTGRTVLSFNPDVKMSTFMSTLNTFFGGNYPAPHNIETELTWDIV